MTEYGPSYRTLSKIAGHSIFVSKRNAGFPHAYRFAELLGNFAADPWAQTHPAPRRSRDRRRTRCVQPAKPRCDVPSHCGGGAAVWGVAVSLLTPCQVSMAQGSPRRNTPKKRNHCGLGCDFPLLVRGQRRSRMGWWLAMLPEPNPRPTPSASSSGASQPSPPPAAGIMA